MKSSTSSSEIINSYTNFLTSQADFLFDGLNSVYKRKQFYLENFDLINPEKVILKSTFSANASALNLDEKSSFGYYIPFKKSLEKLIKNIPSTEKLTFTGSSNDIKTDIFDGNYIKDKLNNKKNKKQLVFLIYCDDIELVNPIGSNRTKHKIS